MCICMYVSMYVLFCHVLYVWCVYCMYIYICIYLCTCIFVYVYIYVGFRQMYICMCVYMYVYLCTYMPLSMYVLVHTFVCIKVIQLTACLVDIQVATSWFGIAILVVTQHSLSKLNTTNCTKLSTQVIKINLGNMNSLFPTLIVNNSCCMHLLI